MTPPNGPGLWLPGRFDRILAASQSPAQLERPAHYILEPEAGPTIIVAAGADVRWRPPLDEIRAMAQEQADAYAGSVRAQSWPERYRAFQRAMLDKLEREERQTRKPGSFTNAPLRNR